MNGWGECGEQSVDPDQANRRKTIDQRAVGWRIAFAAIPTDG